jgi:hypothetical protein
MIPPADRQALTHCVLKVELGKPVFLLIRKTYGNAGRGGWRKRMPTCNGLDTGSRFARLEREQTSGMVLNHVKRSGRNNCIGVEDDIIYGIAGLTGYGNSIPKARIVKSAKI